MDYGYDGDDMNQKRVVRGHGPIERRHKVKLKAFEDRTVVANARWQNLP
jgi:hypothetical protein